MEISTAPCHSWPKSRPQELRGIGKKKIHSSAVQVSPHANAPVPIATAELRFIIQRCAFSLLLLAGCCLFLHPVWRWHFFIFLLFTAAVGAEINPYSAVDAVLSDVVPKVFCTLPAHYFWYAYCFLFFLLVHLDPCFTGSHNDMERFPMISTKAIVLVSVTPWLFTTP